LAKDEAWKAVWLVAECGTPSVPVVDVKEEEDEEDAKEEEA